MVYVHLAEGFEEVEALTCVDVLRRAGIDVQTVSITGEKVVTGTHGIPVTADLLYEEADYASCEMIVLPGGLPGADHLQAHAGLAEHIRFFAKSAQSADGAGNASCKKLAAICAAPQVFGACGILDGKRATIYPGMEAYLKEGQATGENVTVDGNIITGMGPAIAMEFALTLVKELKGQAAADEVASGMLYDRR